MTNKIIAVIPARYASIRFPAKPLALIFGKPMIQWTYEQAMDAGVFDAVMVATDDERIADCVKAFGGQVEMTSSDHQTGTDRIWEVTQRYPESQWVVNVQGDEPFIEPEALRKLIETCKQLGDSPDVVTLMSKMTSLEEFIDPNAVKIVLKNNGEVLYFSRAPIPCVREAALQQRYVLPQNAYRHLGVYAYSPQALARFVSLPPCQLEKDEGLEQLRGLEAGIKYHAVAVFSDSFGIDTPADMERLLRLKEDYLTEKGEAKIKT